MEKEMELSVTKEELRVIRIALNLRFDGIRGYGLSEEDVICEIIKKIERVWQRH